MYSSAILILSAVITKIIGAIFRIPLANMLGGEGMGYFSCAYGIFMPIYAVSVTGLPTAIAKLTAENSAFNRENNIRKIKHISLITFGTAGLLFSILMALLAYPFCAVVTDNISAVPAVLCIAPSVFFGCITAVYRGYYEGLRNMYPTAVSQVIEALAKLFSGLGLCYIVLHMTQNNPSELADFLHISVHDLQNTVLVYAAAAAILGVTISTLAGTIFLILRDKMHVHENENSGEKPGMCTDSAKCIIKQLLATVIPIAIGSLITNLTSLIDIATIIHALKKAIAQSPQTFSAYISSALTADELPNFIFGSFTGLAVTIFNLIPTFTNMFGKGVLPTIAEGFAEKNSAKIRRASENVLFTTSFIAVPAGIGISVLSSEILGLLFPSRQLETLACTKALCILGIGVIFLSISTTIFAVLQAAGRSDIPVKLMAVGVAVKFIGNIVLVPIPAFNVNGAALSTLLCYMVIFFMALGYFQKLTDVPKSDVYAMFLKVTFGGVLCGATAFLCKSVLSGLVSNTILLVICILFAVIVYILSTHLMGIFTKSTLKSLIS